jgi:hypothetical protein
VRVWMPVGILHNPNYLVCAWCSHVHYNSVARVYRCLRSSNKLTSRTHDAVVAALNIHLSVFEAIVKQILNKTDMTEATSESCRPI